MTQLELSVEIEKSSNYINGIENNVAFPQPEVIEKICEVLKIKPMQLFDYEGSPQNAVSFDKESFIKEITDELYRRLSADLKADIKKEITEAISTKY